MRNTGYRTSSTPAPNQQQHASPQFEQQYNTAGSRVTSSNPHPSLSYDPNSKTLFIDSTTAQRLNLEDGDTIPLPDNILQQVL